MCTIRNVTFRNVFILSLSLFLFLSLFLSLSKSGLHVSLIFHRPHIHQAETDLREPATGSRQAAAPNKKRGRHARGKLDACMTSSGNIIKYMSRPQLFSRVMSKCFCIWIPPLCRFDGVSRRWNIPTGCRVGILVERQVDSGHAEHAVHKSHCITRGQVATWPANLFLAPSLGPPEVAVLPRSRAPGGRCGKEVGSLGRRA